jgi:hypothetical protein
MRSPARSTRAGILAGVLLLGACATTDKPAPPAAPDVGAQEMSGVCNPTLAALIGGAIGAIVVEENRPRGAAIGAGLGGLACAIINASTRHVRQASEVEGEYRAGHQGRLPEQPIVSVYDTTYNASGMLRAGDEARVVSQISLIRGTKEPVRELREVLEVFELPRAERVMLRAEKALEEAGRAGEFRNTFIIRLPEGMAGGNYPTRTTLYLNDRVVGENRGTLRVVSGRGA